MARSSKRINAGKALVMWPNLVKPQTNKMKPKEAPTEFGATFIFKKGSPELKKLEAHFEEIIRADFTDGEDKESTFKYPLKDGDTFNKKRVRKGKAPIPAMENAVYIQPMMESDQGTPDLYDGKTPLTNREDGTKLFYSGAIVAPMLNIYTYDNQFGAGASMRLIGAQFASHGEKLGGGAGGPTDDLLDSSVEGTGDLVQPEGASPNRYSSDDDADMDFT
jgi:hypothetical protein